MGFNLTSQQEASIFRTIDADKVRHLVVGARAC